MVNGISMKLLLEESLKNRTVTGTQYVPFLITRNLTFSPHHFTPRKYFLSHVND